MYQVQINMAEVDESHQWEDCDDALFNFFEEALNRIDWLRDEYSETFEYRIVEVKR
jgi:hypothetical protein